MLDVLEKLDSFAPMRNALRAISEERGDWAGIPMPLEGLPLVVEPNFPNAELLEKIGVTEPEEREDNATIRNIFYSRHWRCDIFVYEEGGKVRHAKRPAVHGFDHIISTLGAADAWGIEQEGNAVRTLSSLVRHRIFKQYMMTGTFIESSPRSGVTYMFRRLRPTVAMHEVNGRMRILCALCLHPIAYYSGSWAGAMCPTDDVIAHLMMMRGDEHMFWKRSNQHPAHRPEAGLS